MQRTIDHEKQYIADGETRLNDYRARWRAIDTEEFTETVCPTCHQPLPAEQVAEAREAFAAHQQQRKDTLLEDSKFVKRGIAAAQERLASDETALKSAQNEVQKAQIALDSYTPPVIIEPENLPDYDRRKGAILTLIADADKRIDRLSGDTAAEKSRLEAEHAELTRRQAGKRCRSCQGADTRGHEKAHCRVAGRAAQSRRRGRADGQAHRHV